MGKLTKILLVVMIMGLVFGGVGAADAFKLWKGDIQDTKDITIGSLKKGDMYEGEIPYAYDVIAEETTTRTYGPVPVSKTKSPYYLVEGENSFFVINVTINGMSGQFDTLADQTWDELDGKTSATPDAVKVSTEVVEMPDKVKEYLKEYCNQWGMTDAEYAELVEDSYCLRTIKYDTAKYIPIIGIGVAILCAVILIIKKAAGPKVVNL